MCEGEGHQCVSVVGVCIRCMEWNTVLCCVAGVVYDVIMLFVALSLYM